MNGAIICIMFMLIGMFTITLIGYLDIMEALRELKELEKRLEDGRKSF